MPTHVFLSYRHIDSSEFSDRLYHTLTLSYGDNSIFRDSDTIPGGAEFDDYIRGALSITDIMLVVIGPQWLRAADTAGQRRLDQPNDTVRTEIVAAIALKRLVIPLVIDETPMPAATDIPTELAPLPRLQACRIHGDARYDTDIATLRAQIDIYMKVRRLANFIGVVSAVVLPLYLSITIPLSLLQHTSLSRELLNLLIAVAVLAGGNAIYMQYQRHIVWLWLDVGSAAITLGAGLFALTTPGPAMLVFLPLIGLGILLLEIVWLRYAMIGPRYQRVRSLDNLRSAANDPAHERKTPARRGARLALVGMLLGLAAAIVVWPAASSADSSAILRFGLALLLISVAAICVTIAFIFRLIAFVRGSRQPLSEYGGNALLPGFGGFSRAGEEATARRMQQLGEELTLMAPPLAATFLIAKVGPQYVTSPRFAALMGILAASLGLGAWLHATYSAWLSRRSHPVRQVESG